MRDFVFGVLLLAGCASRAPASATPVATAAPTVTPEELTAAPGHVELAALTLNQNGAPGLVLRADGTVERPDGRVLGTLGRDGRFLDANGKLLAEFTPDGEIVDGQGEFLPVTIDSTGTANLLKENRRIALLEDGSIEGTNPNGPVVTVQGVTPRTRRTAMFLLVLSAYPVRPGS